MFHNFGANTCQGDRTVITWSRTVAFLENRPLLANFQSLGSFQSRRDVSKMMCRNIEIGSAAAFSIIVGRRSGPQALWSFNFRRRLIMPCLSILMSYIGSQRASTGGWMTDMSFLLNSELYCLLRMAALPLASDTVRPLSFSGDVPVLSSLHDLMNFQNLFWVLSFPERIESIFPQYD